MAHVTPAPRTHARTIANILCDKIQLFINTPFVLSVCFGSEAGKTTGFNSHCVMEKQFFRRSRAVDLLPANAQLPGFSTNFAYTYLLSLTVNVQVASADMSSSF